MKLVIGLLAALIAFAGADFAQAQCVVDTSTPTYANGSFLRYVPCDATGAQKTTGSSSGGGAGGAVAPSVIASGVTTNASSTPVAGVSGSKTYWAHVTGTGAVTATVEHFGCQTNATTYCASLGTITLSGTTTDYDVAGVGTANYPYHYIVTTNVTGTSATVSAGVNY